MSDIICTIRNKSELTTPVSDEGWDWEKVNEKLKRCGPITWFILIFFPWKIVTAPKGTPCELTNMYGDPLYRFKLKNGRTYCLECEPSPGFPGS